MSILPTFMASEIVELENESSSSISVPDEYGIDFNTGLLTGDIVKGIEAIKVWIWHALHVERYRHPIYSWQYGCSLEDYIGQSFDDEYLNFDCRSEVEEALKVNPSILGIDNFTVEINGSHLKMSFTTNTILGEVEMNV